LKSWQLRQTSPQVVAQIDTLLDHHTEGQIAHLLNEGGYVSGQGQPFDARLVQQVRRNYALKTRYDRLRDAGMLTVSEIADRLGLTTQTVNIWRRHGLLQAHPYNDKNECLYEDPGDNPPVKRQGIKLSKRQRLLQVTPDRNKEVQCEA